MIRLEVRRGEAALRVIARDEGATEPIRIGRGTGNDLVIETTHVSSDHARVVWTGERYVLQDLKSTNGTALVRGGVRTPLNDGNGRSFALEHDDVIELGVVDAPVVLAVSIVDEGDTGRVVAERSIDDLSRAVAEIERRPSVLRNVHEALVKIAGASELDEVLRRIGDAVLALVPKATHATIALREDDGDDATSSAAGAATKAIPAYVPMLTRVRGDAGAGPIAITRSVFRKVVQERAAVLAADAPAEVGSASILGAQIRSTLGVPLWKGDEILGILQVDHRGGAGAAAVFETSDLDLLSVLAQTGSLAIANARMLQRLTIAEERLRKENTFLKVQKEKREGRKEIIGRSKPMEALRAQLDKVVNTRVTVLIEGETGSGKELIASAVHYKSARREKLFVAQNCAALPESLLESELFGHKKGSFTGATEDKRGLFELADGGTLFLDEVTEMSLSLQSKLLRVLQEGEVRAVGGLKPIHVNVRIVAASNRNLQKEVAEKRFREDLYYRLAVFPIRVPPLRERREDVPHLVTHFLARYSAEIGKATAGVSQQAMELLQGYDWPGNVRELENEVQRLVIQVDPGGVATPDLLSPRIRQVDGVVDKIAPKKGTLREMVDQVERYLLIESLREHNNNKTASARTLGITREGLHKKLRAFGIS